MAVSAPSDGQILAISASASRLSPRDERFHSTGGFGVANGVVETFVRVLAAEVASRGVRVVGVRSDALPETWPVDAMNDDGSPIDETVGRYLTDGTLLDRLPRLSEVADTVAFLASDRASAITATVVNVSSGSVLD